MKFTHPTLPAMELDIIPDYLTDGWRVVGRRGDATWVLDTHVEWADAADDHTERVAAAKEQGWVVA